MMSDRRDVSPGTVSKILWHFTGGPTWNAKTKKQNATPKASETAYANLKSILRSGTLQLGDYREVVRVILPERREIDAKTKALKLHRNVPIDIESSPICCVSDIPAPHLGYHSYRYGKFALGFHRDAVIRAGFNPVLYTLEDTPIVRSIYEGFSSLEFADPETIQSAVSTIESQVSELESEHDDLNLDVSNELWEIESEADSLVTAVSSGRKSLDDFVAFVKTFSLDEFSTVYCEREWRSTKEYSFDASDLAMIVLPKAIGSVTYFKNFVERVLPNLKLPRTIPVVPWDDLVEH